jgi:tRNA (guanine37-N1)-methyltransferase
MIHFHIVTLFPESIDAYFGTSILGRAQTDKKINVSFYNPRDYTSDAYGRVDRRPYGGGPGMVLEPEAMLRAAMAAIGRKKGVLVVFFSPAGELFSEAMAQELITQKHIVFICGRYEGVDARVAQILKARHISVGPYVLTGGELPAATMIDAIARFVPGVLGRADSLEASRVSSSEVYTRPETLVWKGKKYQVPEVLRSGNHAEMDKWKKERGHKE